MLEPRVVDDNQKIKKAIATKYLTLFVEIQFRPIQEIIDVIVFREVPRKKEQKINDKTKMHKKSSFKYSRHGLFLFSCYLAWFD